MTVIAAYERTGGAPPADDERLEIDADGGWRLWRTMGGERVGSFAGRLSADRRRRLASAIGGASDAGAAPTPSRPRPDAAQEAFRAGRHTLGLSAGRPVEGGWAALVSLLRRWSESLAAVAAAEAALSVELLASGPVLTRAGRAPLRVWPATLRVDVYARDEDGIVTGRSSLGSGDEDAPRGDAITTDAGWWLPIEGAQLPPVPAGGRLEAWVWLDIEGPDGTVTARLVVSATP